MRGKAWATPISPELLAALTSRADGLGRSRGGPGRSLASSLGAVGAGRGAEAWAIGQQTAGNPMRAVGPDRGHNGKEQRCRQHAANDNHFHFLFLSALPQCMPWVG